MTQAFSVNVPAPWRQIRNPPPPPPPPPSFFCVDFILFCVSSKKNKNVNSKRLSHIMYDLEKIDSNATNHPPLLFLK